MYAITDKLRPHVDAIKKSASLGNEKAQAIINLYTLHCACPSDPGAPALCEVAFNDWMRAKINTPT